MTTATRRRFATMRACGPRVSRHLLRPIRQAGARRILRRFWIGIGVLLAAFPVLASHDKSDVVTLDDGSKLIGEIKSVLSANLSLHTNAAGTIAIEWRHVTGVVSKFDYRVEVTGGASYFGSLGTPSETGKVAIVTSTGTTEVALDDVVSIYPVEHGFWNRFDGSINFGLSYTQANSTLQYNLSADATYRTRKTYATTSLQSIFNRQTGAQTTNQNYFELTVAQLTRKNWSPFELAQLQSNPDQGYDLRTVLGGGGVYFIKQTEFRLALFNVGLVYNREEVTSSPDVDTSAEVMAGVAFRRFKRGSHSPRIDLSLVTFTDVTGDRRFRASFNFNISWKIVGDLTINFQVRNNYDSSPPEEGANKNDISVVTSVGYTF